MSEPFNFLPTSWSDTQVRMYNDTFGGVMRFSDQRVEALFNEGLFNFDHSYHNAIQKSLREYLMDNYGIDFDEHFDWDAWREQYDGSGL